MELKRATIVALWFAVMLLFTSEMVTVQVVEGRICRYPSHRFHGLCFSDRHCADVCQREGFLSGDCEGVIRHRCLCHKAC